MGRPSFVNTHAEPFTKDNGDEGVYTSTTVCPYCKLIIRISYDVITFLTTAESKCPHLQHFETVTGHNCIFEFFKGGA